MQEQKTKATINLKEGIIMLEGSESFVTEYLEKYSTMISDYNRGSNTNFQVKEDKNDDSEKSNNNDRYKNHFGVEKSLLDKIIYTDDESFRLITHDIKGNNAEKQEKISLLYCLAKDFYTDESIETNEIRELCKEYSCYDSANFATNLRNRKEYFIIDGQKGSPKKQLRLTIPGKSAAMDLIKELVSEDK